MITYCLLLFSLASSSCQSPTSLYFIKHPFSKCVPVILNLLDLGMSCVLPNLDTWHTVLSGWMLRPNFTRTNSLFTQSANFFFLKNCFNVPSLERHLLISLGNHRDPFSRLPLYSAKSCTIAYDTASPAVDSTLVSLLGSKFL